MPGVIEGTYVFYITKLYDHTLGWSACFRQPGASSHCRDPHGYPLAFKLVFAADTLDNDNWVFDFGGLKPVKAWLEDTFDHRTILAYDDPFLADFQALYEKAAFRDIVVLPYVGCEGFAKYAYDYINAWLHDYYLHSIDTRGLRLVLVEVREHAGNSAIYEADV